MFLQTTIREDSCSKPALVNLQTGLVLIQDDTNRILVQDTHGNGYTIEENFEKLCTTFALYNIVVCGTDAAK